MRLYVQRQFIPLEDAKVKGAERRPGKTGRPYFLFPSDLLPFSFPLPHFSPYLPPYFLRHKGLQPQQKLRKYNKLSQLPGLFSTCHSWSRTGSSLSQNLSFRMGKKVALSNFLPKRQNPEIEVYVQKEKVQVLVR